MTIPATNTDSRSVLEILAEGSLYFMGQGALNRTLAQLQADLNQHQIDYVVIGAVALLAHGYPRYTEDIDLVVTSEGLNTFNRELVGLGYAPAFPGARNNFRSSVEGSKIEFLVAGGFPGDGRPKPIQFPDPAIDATEIEGVRFVTIEGLIELKLASGMTAPDRLKDLADVQELVKFRGLSAEFAEKLHPYVREQFLALTRAVEQAGQQADD